MRGGWGECSVPGAWPVHPDLTQLPLLTSGCGRVWCSRHNLVTCALISVHPLLVIWSTSSDAFISGLTLTHRDLVQVALGWSNVLSKVLSP